MVAHNGLWKRSVCAALRYIIKSNVMKDNKMLQFVIQPVFPPRSNNPPEPYTNLSDPHSRVPSFTKHSNNKRMSSAIVNSHRFAKEQKTNAYGPARAFLRFKRVHCINQSVFFSVCFNSFAFSIVISSLKAKRKCSNQQNRENLFIQNKVTETHGHKGNDTEFEKHFLLYQSDT